MDGAWRSASLGPYDHHPASAGQLTETARWLERLAGQGVDLRGATDQALRPAQESWEGLAAAELREAPAPLRRQAVTTCDALAWLAGAVWFWREQVALFNSAVTALRRERDDARRHRWGVPLGDEYTHELQLARQEHERRCRDRWHRLADEFIDNGSRTAASLLREGPSWANLDLLQRSGIWREPPPVLEVFWPRWQAQAVAELAGADLSPAPGTPSYDKAQQDLDSLPPDLIALAISYALHLAVPVPLVIALLMQEQPFYANGPTAFQETGKRAVQGAGALGLGHAGDTSVGRVQMKAPTAERILQEAGYGQPYSTDELRHRLTHDDEFAIAMAVLHLKLDLDSGMTEKQAYLSYSLSPEAAADLQHPSSPLVQRNDDLSARSARYEANLAVLQTAGDPQVYFGVDETPPPRYGCPASGCPHTNCRFEPALAPEPLR